MIPTALRKWARTLNKPPLFALDHPPLRINPWESFLKGWVVAGQEATVGILVDGVFVRAEYCLPRPDVAAALNDPSAENSGFYIRFKNPLRHAKIKLVLAGKARRAILTEVEIPAANPATSVDTYQDWLIHCEPKLFWPEAEVASRLTALGYQPLISVVVPATHSARCVRSLQAQQYTRWQLCSGEDAAGDFVVSLGQDDELHPSALLEVVKRLNEQEGCMLLYSDEDEMDMYGSRSKPVFKPDFDPDMFAAYNYLGNLLAKKRAAELGGAVHIAKPLYHRRIGGESPAEPIRVKYSAPRSATVAVFIRPEDGDFQLQTVRAFTNHGREVKIYQTFEPRAAADVLVFINRPLESLNHAFIEELAGQALREECGLVTGIALDIQGRALPSGFVRAGPNELIDPFMGLELKQLRLPRAVETISDGFFAIRREHLDAVGGLQCVSLLQMPQLVHSLVMNARQRGGRVIVTPYAVATFHGEHPINVKPVPPDQSSVRLNPNLLACKGQFCAALM